MKVDLRQARARSAGSRRCKLCDRAPGPRGVLREQALGLLHPGAAGRRRRRPRSSSSTSHSGYAIRPVLTAILKHPRLYDGPADGEAAGRLHSPGCCARSATASRPRTGSGSTRWPGQQLFYPPNVRGLERRPLARHLDVPRPLADGAARAAEARVQPRPRAARRDRPPADPAQARRPGDSARGARSGSPRRPDAALLAYAEKTHGRRRRRRRPAEEAFPLMTYNALRHLAAVSPEMQTA